MSKPQRKKSVTRLWEDMAPCIASCEILTGIKTWQIPKIKAISMIPAKFCAKKVKYTYERT